MKSGNSRREKLLQEKASQERIKKAVRNGKRVSKTSTINGKKVRTVTYLRYKNGNLQTRQERYVCAASKKPEKKPSPLEKAWTHAKNAGKAIVNGAKWVGNQAVKGINAAGKFIHGIADNVVKHPVISGIGGAAGAAAAAGLFGGPVGAAVTAGGEIITTLIGPNIVAMAASGKNNKDLVPDKAKDIAEKIKANNNKPLKGYKGGRKGL